MADEQTTEAPAQPQKETIVIAEDSPPNRKILAHLLEKLGFQVIACADGQEAWDKLQSPEGAGAVAIISDIMMPSMNGLDLLRKVREHGEMKDKPFVLVTAVSDKEYIMQAKQLNVTGYILKPVTFQRVTGKLTEIFPNKTFPKLAA